MNPLFIPTLLLAAGLNRLAERYTFTGFYIVAED